MESKQLLIEPNDFQPVTKANFNAKSFPYTAKSLHVTYSHTGDVSAKASQQNINGISMPLKQKKVATTSRCIAQRWKKQLGQLAMHTKDQCITNFGLHANTKPS